MRNNVKMTDGRKRKAIELIDTLQELYPLAFPKNPLDKVPLAIGITEQLFEIKDELGVSKKIIQVAMDLWCTGLRYKNALKNIGSPRYNLDGSQSGHVIDYKGMLNLVIKLTSKVVTRHRNGTATLLINADDLKLVESLTKKDKRIKTN